MATDLGELQSKLWGAADQLRANSGRFPFRLPKPDNAKIYFSIIQRKLLRPNDFQSTADVARALNEFEHHYNQIAQPFDWNFTRDDLAELLTRLAECDPQLQLAA